MLDESAPRPFTTSCPDPSRSCRCPVLFRLAPEQHPDCGTGPITPSPSDVEGSRLSPIRPTGTKGSRQPRRQKHRLPRRKRRIRRELNVKPRPNALMPLASATPPVRTNHSSVLVLPCRGRVGRYRDDVACLSALRPIGLVCQRRSRLSSRRSSRRSLRRLTPWATTAAVPTTAAVRATGAPMTPRRTARAGRRGMSVSFFVGFE